MLNIKMFYKVVGEPRITNYTLDSTKKGHGVNKLFSNNQGEVKYSIISQSWQNINF